MIATSNRSKKISVVESNGDEVRVGHRFKIPGIMDTFVVVELTEEQQADFSCSRYCDLDPYCLFEKYPCPECRCDIRSDRKFVCYKSICNQNIEE